MSCFICDEKHISALAGYAKAVIREKSDLEIAKILYEANVRSFNARYEGRYTEEIGAFDFDLSAAALGAHAKPVAVIKAVHCFEYQACEFDGWKESEAKEICRAIVAHAVRSLPGYEQAAWGSPV